MILTKEEVNSIINGDCFSCILNKHGVPCRYVLARILLKRKLQKADVINIMNEYSNGIPCGFTNDVLKMVAKINSFSYATFFLE